MRRVILQRAQVQVQIPNFTIFDCYKTKLELILFQPREPIDKEERIRNKKRIKSLKEKLRRQKHLHKKLSGAEDGLSISGVAVGFGNNGVNSISSSNNLLSVPADTSSNTDRKKKDVFRSHMANFVVHCLNPYFRSSCTTARITNYNDFKHLAKRVRAENETLFIVDDLAVLFLTMFIVPFSVVVDSFRYAKRTEALS